RNERGDVSPRPLKSVNHEHTVAVAVHDLFADVILEITHAADGHGDFYPFVGGRDPERRRSAARNSSHRDPLRIDFRPALEVVDATNAVPAFDRGGRIAARLPPPAAITISAVMNRADFAKLQGIDDQTHVSMRGEPHPGML